MADNGLGLPVRTDGDIDRLLQSKLTGNNTSAAVGSAAQSQTIVDTDGNAHVLAHGHDSTGADHPILTDTIGRPRVVVEDSSDGTPIHNENTAPAVAGGGSVNHDYTVSVGKTLKLMGVLASASGKAKFTVFVGPLATLVKKSTVFSTSSTPNAPVTFLEPIDVVAGDIVRVTKENRETAPASAQDLYDTIIGNEV